MEIYAASHMRVNHELDSTGPIEESSVFAGPVSMNTTSNKSAAFMWMVNVPRHCDILRLILPISQGGGVAGFTPAGWLPACNVAVAVRDLQPGIRLRASPTRERGRPARTINGTTEEDPVKAGLARCGRQWPWMEGCCQE